jgi:hypothetical protein
VLAHPKLSYFCCENHREEGKDTALTDIYKRNLQNVFFGRIRPYSWSLVKNENSSHLSMKISLIYEEISHEMEVLFVFWETIKKRGNRFCCGCLHFQVGSPNKKWSANSLPRKTKNDTIWLLYFIKLRFKRTFENTKL